MSFSPNKNYNLQATGTNVGTWGIPVNTNFTSIDSSLGGRITISVAGNANITVSAAQAQNLEMLMTGVLTGNIQFILPALGGLYMVENDSTGAFTITVMCAGGTIGAIIPQGMKAIVFVNPDDTSIKLDLIGSNYSQGAAASTGSANAQAVATMVPGPYVLVDGALSTWVAGFTNTSAMTLALGGTSAISAKKLSASGYANLASGDILLGLRYLSVYDITNDIHVVLNLSSAFGALASLNIGAGLANDGSGNLTIAANGVVNAMLAQMATLTIKSNIAGGTANALDNTLSAILDAALGATQGDIIYRGASVWSILPPGTSGQALITGGASANPAWGTISATGFTRVNIQEFTSSGTYTPTSGMKYCIVQIVGGGGASGGTSVAGNAGGTTSLGSIFTAPGGAGGAALAPGNTAGALGGTATGGDVNIPGGTGNDCGIINSTGVNGAGGSTLYGYGVSKLGGGSIGVGFGAGGTGTSNTSSTSGSGGGGSSSIKAISAVTIGSSQTVTIGAGGTAGSGGFAGRPGIVIITEFI